MTDIFNWIFTEIATPIRESVPGVFVTGERINSPPKFPCVEVVEADNYEIQSGTDNTLTERLTGLMYEITVFSNKQFGKRSECISILSQIDTIMKRKNAIRIARIEGYFDSEASIYLIKARYRLNTDGANLYSI